MRKHRIRLENIFFFYILQAKFRVLFSFFYKGGKQLTLVQIVKVFYVKVEKVNYQFKL